MTELRTPLLNVVGVSKHFMGVTAVDQVNLEVHPGEVVCLIGPNGSGKSTLFNCITGFLKKDGGQVFFKGEDITGRRPDQIALRGLTRTFQDVRVFPTLSVHQNLMLVAQQHQEDNLVRRFFHTRDIQRFEADASRRADDLLEMLALTRMRDALAGTLSYGQRKLVEFAAALIPDPELVMLDEPAAAVNPTMIERMKHYIRTLNATGKTFLIVEHNMEGVMDLSDRVVVLDIGRKIAEGTPAEIQQNVEVQEAYFGR